MSGCTIHHLNNEILVLENNKNSEIIWPQGYGADQSDSVYKLIMKD